MFDRDRGPTSVPFDPLPPPSADHAIDRPAAALSAPEPPGPFEQRQPRPVALDLFGNVGLDLVPALLAPDNQIQVRGEGAAKCRRPERLPVPLSDRHIGTMLDENLTPDERGELLKLLRET